MNSKVKKFLDETLEANYIKEVAENKRLREELQRLHKLFTRWERSRDAVAMSYAAQAKLVARGTK